ncbi:MAG: OmpA family protein [Deltaproteobacteria bacterium]|nr:OmpA family protein [Deltaproteobacteria bacterium]
MSLTRNKCCFGTMCAFVIFLVGACASKEVPVTPIPRTSQVDGEVLRVGQELAAAKTKGVDVLSPQRFSDAKDHYQKAEQMRLEGKNREKIFTELEKAEGHLRKAMTNAEVARDVLKSTLQQREAAIKAGISGKKFINAETDFRQLVAELENQNMRWVTSREPDLAGRYARLHESTLLAQAESEIEQAKNEGAEKYAPRSLLRAQHVLNSAKTMIQTHPQAAEEIHRLSAQSTFEAERLVNMTRKSRQLAETSPEEAASTLEARAEELEQKGEHFAQEKQRLGQRIVQKEKELSKAGAALKFDERMEQIRKDFSPQEAEIFRQGNRVVLRLKAMQFPTGKATLQPNHFQLLSKVQKAAEELGEPEIIVQGHTDATGSRAANEKLSLERAQTVQQYLLAQGIPSEKIRTEGLGFQQPLTHNKTAEARAQNRRIDIILEPTALAE